MKIIKVVTSALAVMALSVIVVSTCFPLAALAQVNSNDGWSLDVGDMELPSEALTGNVCGNPFSGASAKLTSSINDPFSLDHLILSTANQTIDIHFARKYSLDDLSNQTLTFSPTSKSNVTVTLTCNQALTQPETFNGFTGVGLKIKFGTYARGAIAANMILRLPSRPASYVRGKIAVMPPV
jgi:hypothetical protein